jgi:leucyl/phenylalanyl-tRNA--protein transferase
MRPLLLAPNDDHTPFPPLADALEDPNGLLAIGGALSSRRLEMAYRSGIFPWFSPGEPVLWWSPDPRALFLPGDIRVPRSLRKRLRHAGFEMRLDTRFAAVIRACAEPRSRGGGTWITQDMMDAYVDLHGLGMAHSVEVMVEGELVGGLYGVAIGAGFFGESMFSRRADASKVALVWLAGQLWRWGYQFIDCQLPSEHILRLGARMVPRPRFERMLFSARSQAGRDGIWRFDDGYSPLGDAAPDSI